eukprot:1525415-Prymnesium_polylepis.1
MQAMALLVLESLAVPGVRPAGVAARVAREAHAAKAAALWVMVAARAVRVVKVELTCVMVALKSFRVPMRALTYAQLSLSCGIASASTPAVRPGGSAEK